MASRKQIDDHIFGIERRIRPLFSRHIINAALILTIVLGLIGITVVAIDFWRLGQ